MRYCVLGVVGLMAGIVAFWYGGPTSSNDIPVGIVIPHHDMVAPARAAYVANVAKNYQPKTIILLAPDHFSQNTKPIVTTSRVWHTSLGELTSNKSLITELGIPEQDSAFDGEHAVTTLLQDLKQYFPKAELVPFMLSRRATYQEVTNFVAHLYRACPECLVVASVDFSHTTTATVAALHDDFTLRELTAVNPSALYKNAEVDSPETLAALAQWGYLHDANEFKLFSHTNSGFLTHRAVGEMTTHIIGGYYKGSAKPQFADQVTLMIGGEASVTPTTRTIGSTNIDALIKTNLGERFFWGVDAALIKRIQNPSQSAPLYKYPRDILPAQIYTQGSTKVVVLSIDPQESLAESVTAVARYQAAGYRVILYIQNPLADIDRTIMTKWAETLIDAGANLVIGNESDTPRIGAVYKGVPIIYSLGIFLNVTSTSATRSLGTIVGVRVTINGLELFLVPIHTFQVPTVVPQAEYIDYLAEWTEPWSEYATDRQTYLFPFTK